MSKHNGTPFKFLNLNLTRKFDFVMMVILNSLITDKAVALGFLIEYEFRNVGFWRRKTRVFG